MTYLENVDNARLNAELTDIKAKLNQLYTQVSDLLPYLQQLASVTAQISRLEENFLMVADIHRYDRLRQLLAEGNWEEGDRETVQLLLEIAGKEWEALTPEEIKRYPCNELQVIDQLWCKYSHNRFGFKLQTQAYLEIGGSFATAIEQNRPLLEKWETKLGRRETDHRNNSEIPEEALDVPAGYYPSRWWNSPYGTKMANAFLSRLLSCDINLNNGAIADSHALLPLATLN